MTTTQERHGTETAPNRAEQLTLMSHIAEANSPAQAVELFRELANQVTYCQVPVGREFLAFDELSPSIPELYNNYMAWAARCYQLIPSDDGHQECAETHLDEDWTNHRDENEELACLLESYAA